MDWSQVLAIVLPVMLAIIIGIFYNNRRIDDLREDTNHRFADLRADINRRFDNLDVEMREIKGLLMEFLKKEAGV